MACIFVDTPIVITCIVDTASIFVDTTPTKIVGICNTNRAQISRTCSRFDRGIWRDIVQIPRIHIQLISIHQTLAGVDGFSIPSLYFRYDLPQEA